MPIRRRRHEPEEPRQFTEIRDAGRFRSDREARESVGLRLPQRNPEPLDIDLVSREHNREWREHFGQERDDELYRAVVPDR
jgi:hypothetical protein